MCSCSVKGWKSGSLAGMVHSPFPPKARNKQLFSRHLSKGCSTHLTHERKLNGHKIVIVLCYNIGTKQHIMGLI